METKFNDVDWHNGLANKEDFRNADKDVRKRMVSTSRTDFSKCCCGKMICNNNWTAITCPSCQQEYCNR